jgi:hypothetical protein
MMPVNSNQQPAIVMPLHDPAGLTLPHLHELTPLLETIFCTAYVTLTDVTRRSQPEYATWLETDGFFRILDQDSESPAGEHFRELYSFASQSVPPEQVLHLCYIDRVAFALQTGFRDQFLADIQAVTADRTPLIFHRSKAAWETHPNNYRVLEGIVTQAGEVCYGKTIDFAWCHMAVQAGRLKEIIPQTRFKDISMVAEMALLLLDDVKTRDVDWLAWEDPFICGAAAHELKLERERSQLENLKRLAYVIPMLQLFFDQGEKTRLI